jgi:hypothetical protein
MDPLTISLIIAILCGVGSILAKLHIKKCRSACISSDCSDTNNKDKKNRDSISSLDLSKDMTSINKVVFTDV